MDTTALRMVHTRNTNSFSIHKREHNVQAFSSLQREGLAFGLKERRLLIHATSAGEKVFIQYPGKETVSSNPDKIRPWDFRPKLQLASGEFMKDLSFPDIWDDLSTMRNTDANILAVLASIFFRMAFMEGYVALTSNDLPFEDISPSDGRVIDRGTLSFSCMMPSFPLTLLDEIQRVTGLIRGASLEAYLLYNDLLVQNEDCKYYYRDVIQSRRIWNSKVGRHNTLLSHISVIEFWQGKITFSQIMQRFQRGMGVAPVSVGRVPDITNNIITRG